MRTLYTELPARSIQPARLAATLDAARQLVEWRFGYDVEVAALEPIDRDGLENIKVYWRPSA